MGVGPLELLVILVVALVFVGPERLPTLAADLARLIREVRKYTTALSSEFSSLVDAIDAETGNDRSQLKGVGESLQQATASVTSALRDAGSLARSGAVAETEAAAPIGGQWRDIPEPTAASATPADGVRGATRAVSHNGADSPPSPSALDRLRMCPGCACAVAEGQTFCGSCGTALRPAALAGVAEKRR